MVNQLDFVIKLNIGLNGNLCSKVKVYSTEPFGGTISVLLLWFVIINAFD